MLACLMYWYDFRLLTVHMEMELRDVYDVAGSYSMDFNELNDNLLQVVEKRIKNGNSDDYIIKGDISRRPQREVFTKNVGSKSNVTDMVILEERMQKDSLGKAKETTDVIVEVDVSNEHETKANNAKPSSATVQDVKEVTSDVALDVALNAKDSNRGTKTRNSNASDTLEVKSHGVSDVRSSDASIEISALTRSDDEKIDVAIVEEDKRNGGVGVGGAGGGNGDRERDGGRDVDVDVVGRDTSESSDGKDMQEKQVPEMLPSKSNAIVTDGLANTNTTLTLPTNDISQATAFNAASSGEDAQRNILPQTNSRSSSKNE